MLLPNAECLRWLGDKRILFSEIRQGIQMVLATASESRTGERDIYTPPSDRGMAHLSAISPDGRQVLLTEMGSSGEWLPCRLVPFDGHSPGVQVGPANSRCIGVAWSPDGKWMYTNLDTGNGFHLWRQRPPAGVPEQITFGPTRQHGVAVAPDGRALLTAVGTARVSVWLHHPPEEDRELSAQGEGTDPLFSPDGSKLYYLRHVSGVGTTVFGNLMVVDLSNYRTDTLFPDLLISDYDISPNGKRVVFSAVGADGKQQVWLASLDRRSAPQVVSIALPLDQVFFATDDEIYFRALDNGKHYLQRAHVDGSGRHNVSDKPIVEINAVSPDRNWVVVGEPNAGEGPTVLEAARAGDGSQSVLVCNYCGIAWTGDEKTAYFDFFWGSERGGQAVAVPTVPGKPFPPLPAGGLTLESAMKLPGARRLDRFMRPSPLPGVFAYQKEIVQRNIYRIPLQ
jgi:Tol biopolymer transport system component